MEIIAVMIPKGGTGKTATTKTLAEAALYRGKKTLVIDLDPQGSLTFALNAKTKSKNAFDLFNGTSAADCISKTQTGVDIIPASRNLSTLTTASGSARRLAKALQPIKSVYNLILLDLTPILGELQYNAMQASTGIIAPLNNDILDLQALYQLTDAAEQFKQSNPALKMKGYILTQIDSRSTLKKQMTKHIKDYADKYNIPCLGAIRKGIAISEAIALHENIYEYAPESKPARDYLAAFDAMHI